MGSSGEYGVELFPAEILVLPPYSPDDPITDTGHYIMAGLLDELISLESELSLSTSVESVHESRKTIRRMRTALQLFAPYFPEKPVNKYGKRFGKTMKRFGPSRDTAVFLNKLESYMIASEAAGLFTVEQQLAFENLYTHWQSKKFEADDKLRLYLSRGKFQKLLADFQSFLDTLPSTSNDEARFAAEEIIRPIKTRYVAPVILHKKIAIARAYSDYLAEATPKRLHVLRIEMKEFRYTLEFFQPIMGNTASGPLDTVKEILTILGDLNDARVQLQMLSKTQGETLSLAVALYEEAKKNELVQLMTEIEEKWLLFDNPDWRRLLGDAIAVL